MTQTYLHDGTLEGGLYLCEDLVLYRQGLVLRGLRYYGNAVLHSQGVHLQGLLKGIRAWVLGAGRLLLDVLRDALGNLRRLIGNIGTRL
jgi:hypothetical protein